MTRPALATLALLLTAAPASADALQDRLLAGARAVGPEDVAYTRTIRAEQRSGGAPEVHVRVDRWDPARPAPQRWGLMSIDGRAPTSDEIVGAAKDYGEAPVPSYGRLARWLGSKAVCDAKVCRYAALPKGILVVNGHDLSADTSAEVTIGGTAAAPFVERVHFVSAKGFRMMLVARVDKVEAWQRYAPLPGGVPAPVEFVTEMTGAMMGKTGVMRTVTSFGDQRLAAASPTH